MYEVPCKDCEYVYTGQTKRTLEKRFTEHKAAVKKEDESNGLGRTTDQTGKKLQQLNSTGREESWRLYTFTENNH